MQDTLTYYKLIVVRKSPIQTPSDLYDPLKSLIDDFNSLDPNAFVLYGYSPAYDTYVVQNKDSSNLNRFLESSEFTYPFGKLPSDPTHGLNFFSNEQPQFRVHLHISFFTGTPPPHVPALAATLQVDTKLILKQMHQEKMIDTLFSILIQKLKPEFGYIELPDMEYSGDRPDSLHVGWITYIAKREREILPEFQQPTVSIVYEEGRKIYAQPSLISNDSAELKNRIALIERQLKE
jgi:hypothetical protein